MNRRSFLKSAAAGGGAAWLAAWNRAQAQTGESRSMKVILWCWDTRMTWDDEPDAIQTRMAAAEQKFAYPKRPESFQTGFRRLVDYCAKIGVHGVIVWGFLRDSHGGVAAAADLCKYAADRGVAILPGVGLCSYGGYYYEGEHPFNLDTYLRRHPERISTAVEERGSRIVTPVLDPSLEANQAWWRDGLDWMLETFQVGGVDFEMGDFIVNPSPGAQAARQALGFEADANLLDVVVATQTLFRHACKARPDALFINCTYRGFHQVRGFPATPYVDALPPETVWEYTLTGMVRQPGFPEGMLGAPAHRKYGYLHWFNASTKTQDTDYVREVARVFPGAHRLGFQFIGSYGELDARNSATADRNYRAQVAWAREPGLDPAEFA
ncbi:MAG: twin-arginine translocation signal domain-containing protein [Candidatus Hydrogenedentes bacterium]|nr:twin-arginine translocation signal domain-containing protein [Candidatus Hydrogenedentota bacterium]